jgi:hypothetical protein
MHIARVDSKKRVVLPDGRPGDLMVMEAPVAGTYVLRRLEPPPRAGKSKRACRQAMDKHPVAMRLGWEQLRKLTREP